MNLMFGSIVLVIELIDVSSNLTAFLFPVLYHIHVFLSVEACLA